jgi:hypothetical protein
MHHMDSKEWPTYNIRWNQNSWVRMLRRKSILFTCGANGYRILNAVQRKDLARYEIQLYKQIFLFLHYETKYFVTVFKMCPF